MEFKLGSLQEAGLRMRAHYAPGVPYLVPDKLADALQGFAGLRSSKTYVPPNPWSGRRRHFVNKDSDSQSASWLICTIGGLGDYLAMLPALLTAQKTSPAARIDLCTEPIGFQLLRCGGFRGGWVEYPLRRDVAETYEAVLLIDDVTDHPQFRAWDLIDVFQDLLDVDDPLVMPTLEVSMSNRIRMKQPSRVRPRIGIQLQGSSPLRSYPMQMLGTLLRELVSTGFEVHLLGEAGACEVESSPPLFHNWCGRTADVEDLIALVEQMDLVLAPDSFMAHLGGVMRKPTIAMFTTVPSRLRTRYYPTVVAVEPPIGCNPCFGRSTCPGGHDHCLVWDTPPVSPTELVLTIRSILNGSRFDTAKLTPCNPVHA